MAIGALLGERHSFMHDLESSLRVLFWIYNAPDESRVVPRFEKWNYADTEELAEPKEGQVSHEGDFMSTAEEKISLPTTNHGYLGSTGYGKAVVPNGGRWKREDKGLYARMREIL